MVAVASALQGRVATTIMMPRAESSTFQKLCRDADIPFRVLSITRGDNSPKGMLRYFLRFPIDIFLVQRALRREGIDLVHVSGGAWQFKSVIAAKVAGKPVIWHLNDTSMPRLVLAAFRCFAPLADGLIFASERTRDYYQSLVTGRISEIIPATVDSEWFNPNRSTSIDSEMDKALGPFPVVGTVANVNPYKGIEDLLNAIAEIIRKMPNVKALVVGPVYKNQKQYFEKLVRQAEEIGLADHIVWAGAQDDVRPFLKRMDVFLCSSRFESSPMAVWEAMAMALPVVSTDVGDVKLHIHDDMDGNVVDVGDEMAIASRVCDFLNDDARRHAIGVRNRTTAKKVFSPSVIARKTEEMYNRVWQKLAAKK